MRLVVKNKDQVIAELNGAIAKTVRREVLDKLCTYIVKAIRDRTKSGQDESGKAFNPYSTNKMYMSLNSKYNPDRTKPQGTVTRGGKGKSVKFTGGYAEYKRNLGIPEVNLMNKGLMLQSLTWKINSGTLATIFVAPNRNRDIIGSAHQAGSGNLKVRKWFGYGNTKSEKDALLRIWETFAKTAVKEASNG